jgi:alpha-galactosidase
MANTGIWSKNGTEQHLFVAGLSDSLELLLDTNSGGMGVLLERTLHAADIVTTENLSGENRYHTDIRFCKMMCTN